MFHIAILLGIYSYVIFFLGITHLLYKEIVIGFTIIYIFVILTVCWKKIRHAFSTILKEKKLFNNKLIYLFVGIFTAQLIVNLLGALGPELAFDALWYHLTLPKLFLENHAVYHIPGGLLYYSGMPKLGEMFYVAALSFGNEINAKILQLLFGLLTSIVIYIISRKFFTPLISLIAVLIFYANLVVAWESITAYIDLIRAFFEIMALWAFVNWWQTNKRKWLIYTALMVGLAISSKLLALASMALFMILIAFRLIKERVKISKIITTLGIFTSISLFIPLPWFLFAYINTGNPIYPIFSDVLSGLNAKVFDINLLDPILFISTIWNILTHANDPLTPIYIIFFPLLLMLYKKVPNDVKLLYWFSLLALILWYPVSQIEGARMLIPYLPAFSIICAAVIAIVQKDIKQYGNAFYSFLIGLVILVSLSTIGYRFIANSRYIPVVIGAEAKQSFLTNNLNFSFGDFYDTDGFFAKTITEKDTVLIIGFHNLYYVDFPYTHISWIKEGEAFNYIAVQDVELPQRFQNWKLIYENKTANVKLYSDGGKVWKY